MKLPAGLNSRQNTGTDLVPYHGGSAQRQLIDLLAEDALLHRELAGDDGRELHHDPGAHVEGGVFEHLSRSSAERDAISRAMHGRREL
jgi:hypothetical protein